MVGGAAVTDPGTLVTVPVEARAPAPAKTQIGRAYGPKVWCLPKSPCVIARSGCRWLRVLGPCIGGRRAREEDAPARPGRHRRHDREEITMPRGHSGVGKQAQGPETIAIVTVDVYEPADALAGTLTYQPTGLAAVLPPMTGSPSPDAAAAL